MVHQYAIDKVSNYCNISASFMPLVVMASTYTHADVTNGDLSSDGTMFFVDRNIGFTKVFFSQFTSQSFGRSKSASKWLSVPPNDFVTFV